MDDEGEGFIAECSGCTWQYVGPDEDQAERWAESHCSEGHDTVVQTLTSWTGAMP